MSSNNEVKWVFSSFEMPELWFKDDEIYNLMQSFKRPRNIDPTAYDFKINFWSTLIMKYALHHHVIIINETQIQSIFTREFKSSGISLKLQCANTVLRDMVLDEKLKEVSTFEGGNLIGKLITGVGWIIKAPLNWSYNKISSVFYSEDSSIQDNDSSLGDLVIVDAVHNCLKEFMDWIVKHTDLHISPHLDVMTMADFNQLLTSYFPHKTSRNLAQQILINRKQIEIITLNQSSVLKIDNQSAERVQVVKFSRSVDVPISNVGLAKEVMDQINGLVQLRALAKKLEADELKIEEKIQKIKETTKMCLRAKKIEEAKNHLKRGKITEKMLERKRMQLQNVESMLIEIEASTDNMEVVKALSNAASALKARTMDLDSVQDAMAEVGDTLAEQDQINASISAIGDIGNDVRLLENELADLLNDNISDGDLFPEMPDVPAHSLSPQSINNPTSRIVQTN